MANYPLGVTKSLQTWRFNQNHVERILDNSAYDAAHPDDTLLLAGPARREVIRPSGSTLSTMAIGLVTDFSMNSSVSTLMPVMGIGSARTFFLRGKSQSTWSLSRPMINGRNLLRVLYHNAVEAGINTKLFDDQATDRLNSQFFINLDSELYYIPFGLGVVMRTKAHTLVASCWLELCMIQSWQTGARAGSPSITEAVSGVCDRIVPYQPTSDISESPAVGRNLMDAVLGLAQNTFPAPSTREIANFNDSGLGSYQVSGV